MDSKNDPRSVDWAPEQIARLKERLDGLTSDTASEIEALTERLNGMVPYVELAARVLRLEQGMASMSEQANVHRDRINELQNAKVRSELSAGFTELDPDFSPAIGGRASDTSDKTHLRKMDVPLGFKPEPYKGIGTGGVVQYEETWSKGYAAGVAAARDEMESRLISALDRLGWRSGSPAWLGVMGVFHADPSKLGEQTSPVKDQWGWGRNQPKDPRTTIRKIQDNPQG